MTPEKFKRLAIKSLQIKPQKREKMKRLITDDYPCKAVRYWVYCNGGGDKMRVLFDNNNTVFVNAHGDMMNFNHIVDFNSADVYEGKFYEANLEELCGEEE